MIVGFLGNSAGCFATINTNFHPNPRAGIYVMALKYGRLVQLVWPCHGLTVQVREDKVKNRDKMKTILGIQHKDCDG